MPVVNGTANGAASGAASGTAAEGTAAEGTAAEGTAAEGTANGIATDAPRTWWGEQEVHVTMAARRP